MSKADPHITPARLKSERFWTDKLIATHLGAPDRLATNPHYRSGPEMRLYSLARVSEVENEPTVAEALSKVRQHRESRSNARKRSSGIKRDALIRDELAAIKTHFDGISLGHLLDLGASGRDNTADEATLRRWAVNFARHELTSYDGVRDFKAGSVGVHAAAEAVRTEVLNRIARQWPELASECSRQAQERKARHEILIAMKS